MPSRGGGRHWATTPGDPSLPWRSTRDPWAVLVSEVMAQQTQLARVVPAYHRFLERFPTPASCAAASVGDVLRAWQGLGYNRRARNLHRAAQAVVAEHARPPSPGSARAAGPARRGGLHGTGRAGLRLRGGRRRGGHQRRPGAVAAPWPGARCVPAEAQRLVDAMVPPGRGWWFGQALLDLGAGTCVARTPRLPPVPHPSALPVGRQRPGGAGPRCGLGRGLDAPEPVRRLGPPGSGPAVEALRRGAVPAGDLAAVVGWEDQPERLDRVVAGLVAEGMVVRTSAGDPPPAVSRTRRSGRPGWLRCAASVASSPCSGAG